MGYALNASGSWTGDLLIACTEDLKAMPPFEIHVKRVKSKEVHIQEKHEFVCPSRTGETLQEGQPLSTAVYKESGDLQARNSTNIFRRKEGARGSSPNLEVRQDLWIIIGHVSK